MTAQDIKDFLTAFGLPLGALIVILITGARKMWNFRWVADEQVAAMQERLDEKDEEIKRERARADWWQQRALDQSSMLDKSLELATRAQQGRGRVQG